MAKRMSKALQPSNSTDAHFRAWSKFIFDTMIDGGWVQTADTGQINFTTVTRPTLVNEARGYIIMRMADSLQTTTPVYVRIDFGSAAAASNMGIWVTIGSGSSGAGVITPVWLSTPTSGAPNVVAASNSTSLSPTFSFGSADTSRVAICLCLNQTTAGNVLLFAIERAKTSGGADSTAAVLFQFASASSPLNRGQWLYTSLVPPPPAETGFALTLSTRNPSAADQNVGASSLPPFAGLAQQPGMSFLAMLTGDQQEDARIKVNMYGTLRTYQGLMEMRITGYNGGVSSLTQLFMRFE